MGSFYEDFGRSEQAETLYKEAIAMCRRLYKGDHPDLATKISNIALFFFTKGRYAEAEPIFKEALEMRRRIFKDGHTDLATIINRSESVV